MDREPIQATSEELVCAVNGLVRSAIVKDIGTTYENAVKVRTAAAELLEHKADSECADFHATLRCVFESLKAVLAVDSTEEDKLQFVRNAVALGKSATALLAHDPAAESAAPAASSLSESTLPPLADYHEDEPPSIPIAPIAARAAEIAEAHNPSRRRSIFCAMLPREDTKDLYKDLYKVSVVSESADELLRARSRSHDQLSYPARVLTAPRPHSTSDIAASGSGSQIRVAGIASAPTPPTHRPRAFSAAPPMLSAKQAQNECTRAQWILVAKTLSWAECYMVLRGIDLYLFKEDNSPKASMIMRIDKYSQVGFARTNDGNGLRVSTHSHKLLFRTERACDVLTWKMMLEKIKG